MPQKHTLRNASLLFLVVLVLLVTLGSLMQVLNFSWGLIGTELFCILVPALVYLRLNHLPARSFLGLRWPGLAALLLAAAAGLGLWQFDAWLDNVMSSIFGYSLYLPPTAYPTSVGQSLVFFAALAFSAPLCEEILFRGVFLRSFQPWGPRFAVLLSSALFVFFHMRLQGFAALVPVALLLGYVAWRSGSIFPAMLIHFVYNAFAAVLTILGTLRPDMVLPFPSTTYAAVGLGVAAVAVWLFNRAVPDPRAPAPVETASIDEIPAPVPAAPRPRLVSFWPLVLCAFIWIAMVGLEFVVGAHPEVLALGSQMRPPIPAWSAPERWSYAIHNKAGNPVGQMDCQVGPTSSTVTLSCRQQVKGYQVTVDRSTWQDADHTTTFESQWTRSDGLLAAYQYEKKYPNIDITASVQQQGGKLVLSSSDGQRQQQIDLPSSAFMDEELPFRLAGTSLAMSQARWAQVAFPNPARTPAGDSGPVVQQALIYVEGGEPVMSPQGPVLAWRVKIGKDRTAWYEVDGQRRLLKYEDNMLSYTLK